MRTTYIANTTEAANLHSGKQTAIVTLVNPQPKDCFPIHQLAEELCTWRNEPMSLVKDEQTGRFYCKYCGNGCDYGNNFHGLSAPYQPRQTIAVRERYGNYALDNPNCSAAYWMYAADYPIGAKTYEYPDGDDDNVTCDFPIWRSPVTMPREAVRTWLLVKDVCCVRVQDMTSEQVQTIWPDMNNIDRMQELHRKLGSDAWADNALVFITKVEKI